MEGEVTNVMTQAVTSILDVATTVLETITSDPNLALFFFAGIIGIAVSVVKRLK